MPTAEHMRAVVDAYCRYQTGKKKEQWLGLFAPDATHEDPVGVLLNEGIEKIGGFWDSFQVNNVELWLTEDTIVCGNEAIAFMKARVGPEGQRFESPRIIDQFVFNDEGKIAKLRAFYNVPK